MNIRPCRLPADIDLLMEVLVDAFQFPDHESWSVPTDLADVLHPQLSAARHWWPLLKVAGLVYPAARTLIGGFIAEVDGQAVGVANITRPAAGPYYEIGNVGVRPAFRRQGIARALMHACLEHIRAIGGRWVSLNVVTENTSAVQLYDDLGFRTMTTSTEMSYGGDSLIPSRALPYTVEERPFGTWHERYTLARRLTHPYYPQPITPTMVRPSRLVQVVGPWFLREAQVGYRVAVVCDSQRQIVAVGDVVMQESTNSATIIGDPADPQGGTVLLEWITTQPTTLSVWQPFMVREAEALGYGVDFRYRRMGFNPNRE